MEDGSVGQALMALSFEDEDGQAMVYQSHRRLEADRLPIIAKAFPECAAADGQVMAVVASSTGKTREFIAIVKDISSGSPSANLVMTECRILYTDLTPSECCEYSFAEDPDSWMLSKLSLDALESYRSSKFESWKSMLTNPVCEAQFRRMLAIGIVTRLYDEQVFPTPDSQKSLYEVTDDKTGKLIQLPHPVSGLRIWSSTSQSYDSLDSHLIGAPSEADKSSYWEGIIQDLKAKLGEEYVSKFLQ